MSRDAQETELSNLKVQREVLSQQIGKLQRQVDNLQGQLAKVDQAMGMVLTRMLGVEVQLGAGGAAVVPQVEATSEKTPIGQALDDVTGASSIVEEEKAWAVLLRTPRQKKKWAQVKLIQRALESVGGRARVGRLFPAVRLLDTSFGQSQLTAILARDDHFEADSSRQWFFVPGPPMMTDPEKQVYEDIRMIADVIVKLGGEARFSEILDEIHKDRPPSTFLGPSLARHLRSCYYEHVLLWERSCGKWDRSRVTALDRSSFWASDFGAAGSPLVLSGG